MQKEVVVKDLSMLWKGGILITQVMIMVFGFFINRTLAQLDGTDNDHEMRLRNVETMSANNASVNESMLDLVKVYMEGMKEDITDLKTDIREIKAKMEN